MGIKKRILWVAVFAAAMAWIEAAVVLDLRVLVGRLQPYQPVPLPNFGGLGPAEVVREFATMVLLLAAGRLAGSGRLSGWAYSAIAFGVWDILYYVFLIPLTGWPRSLLDWDILFLIPVPWWGPVLAPAAVSLLLICGGLLFLLLEDRGQPGCLSAWAWAASILGATAVLYAFTADSIRAVVRGNVPAGGVLPVHFHWIVFAAGFLLMAVPVGVMVRRYGRILRRETDRPDNFLSGPRAL
jgi:hypothetical protein